MMARSTSKTGELYVTNEFAQVKVTIDDSGNDPRLCIEDLSTDRRIYLDAFMLAGLTTATEQELARFADPNPRMDEPG
jgi:hypothetical protein